ncbi:hydrolase [uncultured Microbacterium sp.]|uniref:HAD family hydrolase n=1 Tax=uncultured Microbacterium sp. TaxID=191216 RepID=UPI0025CC06F0|nr:hydrolase [uncultured Microbacterium sp.]
MPRPVLIFDFDGTVAVGDGPLLAYARAVAAHTASVDAFVSTVSAHLAAPTGDVIDGYDAVRRLALEAGVDDDALAAAYTLSRTQLGSVDAPVSTAVGLAEFLAHVDAERLLVTNAPATRLDAALSGMGLAGLFDRVVTDAAKPAGLEALLASLGEGVPVLAIGDVWRNDLAPAHARGFDTALVGGYADAVAAPTFRADTLDELLPALAAWVDAARVDAPPAAHLPSPA